MIVDERERFKKLLEPLQVKNVRFRNRMVKPATTLGFAASDGNVSDMQIAFYSGLAQGGVGLLITESSCVDFPIGGKGENRLRLDDDVFIPSFSRLTEAIHSHGCPTFLQLTHNGPAGTFSGLRPLVPSELAEDDDPVADPRMKYDQPRAMTRADIEHCIEKHADAVWRAQKAGFDGVEIHAGHSYLLNSFLSRVWNRRDDEYGCASLATRARFPADIIRAARARVGKDFVIGMRINGQEWGHERGTTSAESAGIAKLLEAAGLDIINVTNWGYGKGDYAWAQYAEQLLFPERTVPTEVVEKPGIVAGKAAIIKEAVSIPVIAVGSLGPELGEWVLRHGKADAIAMGRRLLADPELPRKIAEGRFEDVRPCMQGLECRTEFGKYKPAHCRVNAALGKEREYEIKPAARKKKVFVIGAGPGGMEAAIVAAARGHQVTLYEKESALGGSMPLAALIKGTEIENLPALVSYYETQLHKRAVNIRLGEEFTPALARSLKPEVVVVATGGQRVTPHIPGIDHKIVLGGEVLARKAAPFLGLLGAKLLGWATRFWLPVGNRVVIMGGQLHGCQLAAFMVKRGRRVTIVESSDQLGDGISIVLKNRLLGWLRKKGTIILTGVEFKEITDAGLVIRTPEGETATIAADSIITALPPASNPQLARDLQGLVPEIHAIGDCTESRLILQAIADGARVGHAI